MSRKQFSRGETVRTCQDCGRQCRPTNGGDIRICDQCYELAGMDNALADGHFEECGGLKVCVSYALEAASKGGSLEKLVKAYPDLFPQGLAHFAEAEAPAAAEAPKSEGYTVVPNGKSFCISFNGELIRAAKARSHGTPLRLFGSEEAARKFIAAKLA